MNKQLAIKLNTEIIRYSKSPHERDLARMRINILKKALKRKKEKQNERQNQEKYTVHFLSNTAIFVYVS